MLPAPTTNTKTNKISCALGISILFHYNHVTNVSQALCSAHCVITSNFVIMSQVTCYLPDSTDEETEAQRGYVDEVAQPVSGRSKVCHDPGLSEGSANDRE